MTRHTIRPATASDLDRIKEIAVAADMFSTEEAAFFDEMVHGALDGSLKGHQWLVVVRRQPRRGCRPIRA